MQRARTSIEGIGPPRSHIKEEDWIAPMLSINEAVALLQSWYAEDPNEHRESWEALKHALEEDRLSDRELFS